MTTQSKTCLARTLVVFTPLYGMWLLLTGGRAWLYGFAVAYAAAGASVWLVPGDMPERLSWRRIPALCRFAAYFMRKSLAGGLDVAWRAYHPGMPLVTHWVDFPLQLTGQGARALFLGTISITPGTLGADLRGDSVRVHAIINNVEPDLKVLERRVADVFGQILEDRT